MVRPDVRLAGKRAVRQSERNVFVITCVVREDFCSALFCGVVDDANSRRPFVGHRQAESAIAAIHVLDVVANAHVQRDEIHDAPAVLEECACDDRLRAELKGFDISCVVRTGQRSELLGVVQDAVRLFLDDDAARMPLDVVPGRVVDAEPGLDDVMTEGLTQVGDGAAHRVPIEVLNLEPGVLAAVRAARVILGHRAQGVHVRARWRIAARRARKLLEFVHPVKPRRTGPVPLNARNRRKALPRADLRSIRWQDGVFLVVPADDRVDEDPLVRKFSRPLGIHVVGAAVKLVRERSQGAIRELIAEGFGLVGGRVDGEFPRAATAARRRNRGQRNLVSVVDGPRKLPDRLQPLIDGVELLIGSGDLHGRNDWRHAVRPERDFAVWARD